MSLAAVPGKVYETEIERMMAEYGSALLRMSFLYLKDAALAEDAVQETFLKAFKHLGQFRGASSEKTWLMRIAINTCRDFQRSVWLRLTDRRTPIEQLPDMACETALTDDTVLCEVMQLPARDKAVILLRYYQNMSTNEISEALGIPVPTVSSRLKRAKEKLHKKLERWYFDD